MKFKADEIASVIQHEIEQFESQIDVREVGRVIEVGDGIARVYGLSGVMSGEMIEFPDEIFGLAFNLEENSVGVIILGDYLQDPGGRRGPQHGPAAERAGGRGRAGPRARSAGQSAGRRRAAGQQPSAAPWKRRPPVLPNGSR